MKAYRIKFDSRKDHYVWSGGKNQPRYEELLALMWLNRKRMPGPWKLTIDTTTSKSNIKDAAGWESHIRRECVFRGLTDRVEAKP